MHPLARAALAALDFFMATAPRAAVKDVWRVLTGFRGPDIRGEYSKLTTVVPIRRAALPHFYASGRYRQSAANKNLGAFNEASLGIEMGVYGKDYKLQIPSDDSHFTVHLKKAAEVLGLVPAQYGDDDY